MKITKKAYNHFNTDGIKYIYDDELKPKKENLCQKMQWTLYRIEYMYKCQKGMSKKDYGRLRYTERIISEKMHRLWQCRTKTEDENFQRGMRMFQLEKGCYPFQIDVQKEIDNGNEEFCKFYYEGRYKTGSFIDKFVAHIHRF